MKDCWRWRAMAVEAKRLDLDMGKRLEEVRDKLGHAVRSVNAMRRTLRKSGQTGEGSAVDADDMNGVLYLLPEDQRLLRVEIAAAEAKRAMLYGDCRKLRRRGAVFRARCDRLRRTLSFLTDGVMGTMKSLERIMGQLRSQLSLLRIQERVYQQSLGKVERSGLCSRRRLTEVEEKLMLLDAHPFQVSNTVVPAWGFSTCAR